MEITPEQKILLEAYFDSMLTKEQEAAFEMSLKNDATLFEAYCFEADLRSSLAEMEFNKDFPEVDIDATLHSKSAMELKSQLQKNKMEQGVNKMTAVHKNDTLNVDNNEPLPQVTKVISKIRWLQIAAAAAIIGIVISVIWINNRKDALLPGEQTKTLAQKNDTLHTLANKPEKKEIEKNGQWYSNLAKSFSVRDDVPDEKPLVLIASLEDFKNGKNTIQQFDIDNPPTLKGMDDEDDPLNSMQNIKELGHYYKGLSYISTNDRQLAHKNLQWVIDSAKNTKIKIKANWYLALNYVKYADTSHAMPIINALSLNKKAYPYNEKATQLATQLKQ